VDVRFTTMKSDAESGWLVDDWQRVASLIVAIALLVVSPFLLPSRNWSRLIVDLIIRTLLMAFPLACIWFADEMAEYFQDGQLFPEINRPSSGRFVRLGGWLLLLLPAIIFLLVWLLDYVYR
jgi:hypothetical protein